MSMVFSILMIKFNINFFFCKIEHHFQARSLACLNVSTLLFIADGQCLLINLKRKAVLYHFNFKRPVFDLKFSPNGRYVPLVRTFYNIELLFCKQFITFLFQQ